MNVSADSWAGEKVGGFDVAELLSVEPGCEVYLATQPGRDRTVTLRRILNPLGERQSFRDHLARQSAQLRGVVHPHVITTYGAGDHQGTPYLAARYLPATDLATMIDGSGRLAYMHAIQIISQIAKGLDHVHSEGIIHRGVSPASIVVLDRTDGEHAYLGRFGITEDTTAFGGLLRAPDDGARPAFDYASPEQIRGDQVDARTDVYALTCVLFEAVTGAPPYADHDGEDKLKAHLEGRPPSVREGNPELPDTLDAILAIGLASDPGDRFESALELALALPTKERVLSRWQAMLEAGSMAPGTEVPAQADVAAETVATPAFAGLAGAGGEPEAAAGTSPAGDDSETAGGGDADVDALDSPEPGGDAPDGPGDGPNDGDAVEPGEGAHESAALEERWEHQGGRRVAATLAAVAALAALGAGALAIGGAFSSEKPDQIAVPEPTNPLADKPPPTGGAATGGGDRDRDPKAGRRGDPRPGRSTANGRGDDSPAGQRRSGSGGASGLVAPFPAGTSAYTAIIFASPSDQAGAEAAASQAAALGFRSGVLNSSDYGSLQPGVIVAFAGVYDTAGEAEAAVSRVREAGIASAPYVRFIGG